MNVRFGLVVCAVLAACGPRPGRDDGGTAGGTGGGSVAGGSGGGSTGGGSTGGGDPGDGGVPDCTVHEFRDVFIPMRDGKQLSAILRVPTDARCRLPVILIQTPYGSAGAKTLWLDGTGTNPLFESKAYAVAVVDWRGFFGSTPARVMGQQPYGDDGFDTVEWLATQPFSDGNIATWGVSALCQQQYRTAEKKPPHLKAAVPIFCQANQTYDQYYPGGVLRREFFTFIAGYFGGGIIATAPYRTPVWVAAENLFNATSIEVPMLVVAGWYDLFPSGQLRTWDDLLARSPAASRHRLLIGEWIHFATGGESSSAGTLSPEELQYVDLSGLIQRDSLAFFDLHVRGNATGPASQWTAVRYAQSGAWQSSAAWPPAGGVARDLFLSADGGLLAAAPAAAQVTFTYDPLNPSPTRGGGTLLPTLDHGPTNQNAVSARADAVTFLGDVLQQPLRIAGRLALHLEVSTDRPDTDFTARLLDVQPDGGQLLIAEGVRRLKLRGSYAAPLGVTAGMRYGLDVPFTSDLAYAFGSGHRVGLIVSSSNYPRFDRNPNTGDDFFPDAGSPAGTANNTLHLDGAAKLTLPSVP